MGYRVENVAGMAEENRELAEFLASFVRKGELAAPKEGDDCANVWQRRMSWWWNENPFCREASPRGFVLKTEDGEIVGFNGLVPFDYEVDGEVVPTLVTTTFFVREEHRSAVMGMLAKQRALSREYQIIDGSPSREMRRLLDKFGYRHAGKRYQFFFPLQSLGGGVSRALLRPFGLSFKLPQPRADDGFHLAGHPREIESIPDVGDGRLRRRVTRESLAWLCEVGSGERQFFGLCDVRGTLVAHAIGLYKHRGGLRACLLMDYADFSPEGDGVARLIAKIADSPETARLDPGTNLLTWSAFDGRDRPSGGGLKRDSILHFHVPKRWESYEKACLPFEGDLPLL
ncbi:MAG: hypothetical protein WD342_01785 [Verrucomicrobiales bacterium]